MAEHGADAGHGHGVVAESLRLLEHLPVRRWETALTGDYRATDGACHPRQEPVELTVSTRTSDGAGAIGRAGRIMRHAFQIRLDSP